MIDLVNVGIVLQRPMVNKDHYASAIIIFLGTINAIYNDDLLLEMMITRQCAYVVSHTFSQAWKQ